MVMSLDFGTKRSREGTMPPQVRERVLAFEQRLARLPSFAKDATWMRIIERAKQLAASVDWVKLSTLDVRINSNSPTFSRLLKTHGDVWPPTEPSVQWALDEVRRRTNKYVYQVFLDGDFLEEEALERQCLQAFRAFEDLVGDAPWSYAQAEQESFRSVKSSSWVFENILRDVSSPRTRGAARPLVRLPFCAKSGDGASPFWARQLETLLTSGRPGEDIHILLCDDALYTGMQMAETVEESIRHFFVSLSHLDQEETLENPLRAWVTSQHATLRFYIVAAYACASFENADPWRFAAEAEAVQKPEPPWDSGTTRVLGDVTCVRRKGVRRGKKVYYYLETDALLRVEVTVLYGAPLKTVAQSESSVKPREAARTGVVAPPPTVTPDVMAAVEASVLEFGHSILEGDGVGNAVLQHKIPDHVSYPSVFAQFLRSLDDLEAYNRAHERPYARDFAAGPPEVLADGRFECAQEEGTTTSAART